MSKLKKSKKIIVGLTGGIASGKSAALKFFKAKGAETLDCDQLAREVVRPGQKAYRKIVQFFGPQILAKNKTILRKKLGGIVFNDRKKRKQLESFIHPEVVRLVKKYSAQSKKNWVVVDIPLLFEANLQSLVDKILVMWVTESVQCWRLMARNHCRRAQALQRIKIQMPLAQKKKQADWIIDNNAAWPNTRLALEQLWGRCSSIEDNCFLMKKALFPFCHSGL